MIVSLLGMINIYFFLTGLFKVVNLPTDSSAEPAGPKEYNKIVYLLIDGLRFDSSIKTSKKGHIFNKMKHLESIDSKFHALSVSGIPTETGSRVIGLTTGTPSNFLTSVANLQGCSIYWDNMVRQLLKDGRSSAFFGDCQWISYFPELRNGTHYVMDPYGRHEIRKQEDDLIEKMLQSINNYDVIIAHLINLDSYGHIYETIDHEEMEHQLVIYDNLINGIYKKMSEDTLFVICSDHGVDNNGAHGGVSTLEMSAVGIFISKDERFTNLPSVDKEVESLRKKHISRMYDEDPLLIQSKEPYLTIHQDDILPTLCYLMGVPIPKVSSGNFIHELVHDTNAYKTYCKQKCDVLNIPFEDSHRELNEYIKLNYKLSEEISNRFAGRDHFRLVVSGILSVIIALLVIFRILDSKLYKFGHLVLFFVIIMTGHSVLSIIHEDLFWAILFFAFNPSPKNLLGAIMLLQMIRPPSDTNPFYVLVIKRIKLSPLFNGNLLFILELCLFGILDNITHFEKTLWFFLNSILKILNNYPHVFISLLRYVLGASLDNASWRLSLFVSSPSIDTLIALVFRPMESIYLTYIIRRLDMERSIYTYFSLVNMAFSSSGLQKLFQSINYGVFFTFSDNFLIAPVALIAFLYFIYPRIRAIQLFISHQSDTSSFKEKRGFGSSVKDIITFHSFNLLVVMWSGYVICESLSFYKFLGIRAFFEYLYYISDILLFSMVGLIKRKM
ncbi:putative membrane protein [Encephalitozoon romaleae SJ-2008]|uniref:Membrane protein n=1 Tax=Encephalitozoon romaleae (strain SJ-2008) TaxID=1178016 RepID=I7AF26_ENCRO|nr:putative membrane protein [Encephalitozoon romaleae SJ-2008]AFN83275.1 putative membrane protein [Encephalitozoon romaleae SJ-2008]